MALFSIYNNAFHCTILRGALLCETDGEHAQIMTDQTVEAFANRKGGLVLK